MSFVLAERCETKTLRASAFSCSDRVEKSELGSSFSDLPCFNVCRLFCRHFCLRPYLRTAGSLPETRGRGWGTWLNSHVVKCYP